MLTGNSNNFLSEYRFILLCLFGWISGVFVILLLSMLDESLEDVRKYSILGDKEWNEFKKNVRGKATSKIYWLLFSFWMIYSFYHIFFTKTTWRSCNFYA